MINCIFFILLYTFVTPILYILWKTITAGEKAPANPWGEGATTLEWTVDSPAPFHTHEQIPEIPEEEHGEKIYVSPGAE